MSAVKMKIKDWFSGKVIFEGAFASMRDCVLGAYKSSISLSGADLSRANLSGAHLSGAYISDAHLSGAHLSRADLSRAYLSGADLSGANLSGANLSRADLSRAYLLGADLSGANLSGAYISGANLSGANLSGAVGVELAIAATRILPEGDLIGWKKCGNGAIVKLRIPSDAKRSSAFGRKCRAEFADVIEVVGAEYGKTNAHGPATFYKVGERVIPDSFDENWQEECSHGIHFFITRLEAENY